MVRRKEEFPDKNELVVGEVTNVNPNSAFVRLDEYGKDGMIHISEIAKKWVKDIRNWVKKGNKVVCRVMDVKPKKGHIDLSLKRVSNREKNRRLQRWKRDKRGEKFLKFIGEKKNKSLDEIYDEIGYELQGKFKDLLEPFKLSLERPKVLERKGLKKKWIELIKGVAEENLKIKEKEIVGYLKLRSWESNGIEKIKGSLKYLEDNDIKVKYLSPPTYKLTIKTKNPREGEKKLKKVSQELKKKFKNIEGECDFYREDKKMSKL